MLRLRQVLWVQLCPQVPQEDPHGGEAVQVRLLREDLQPAGEPQDPREASHEVSRLDAAQQTDRAINRRIFKHFWGGRG